MTYAAFEQAMAASTPKALEAELEIVLGLMPEEFEYGGTKKSKTDVRNGFRNALDRRTMRLLIETVRGISRDLNKK